MKRNGTPFCAEMAESASRPDLAGGVEAQAKEEADRVHQPAILHEAEQRTEEASQQATLRQELLDFLLVILATTGDTAKRLEDIHQNQQVERGNQVEEDG